MCVSDHNANISDHGRCDVCGGTVKETGYRSKLDLYDKTLAFLSKE